MSPSSSMVEDLIQLINKHTAHLRQVHQDLGSEPDEIESQITDLYKQLEATVSLQSQNLDKQVETVLDEIQQVRNRLEKMQLSLGDDVSSTDRHENEALFKWKARIEDCVQGMLKQHSERAQAMTLVIDQLRLEYQPMLSSTLPQLNNIPDKEHECDDLRAQTLENYQNLIEQCKQELDHRKDTLEKDFLEICYLWEDLGIDPTQPCKLMSAPHQHDSNNNNNKEQNELEQEEYLDPFNATIIAHFSAEQHNRVKATPNDDNLAKASQLRMKLEHERHFREDTIQKLYDDLYMLWNKLGVSAEDSEDFVDRWQGIEESSVQAYKEEYQRMLKIKAENTSIFIAKEREDIQILWDDLLYGPQERNRFGAFYSEIMDEQVLQAHEEEKQRLQIEREEKAPALKLIHKYCALLEEMAELEAAANDPNRLTGKGARGDPGRLLREEKSRKRVQREKPKLEKELLDILPQWEEERGTTFYINGSSFLDDLQKRLDEEKDKNSSKRTRSTRTRTISRTQTQVQENAPATKNYTVPLKGESNLNSNSTTTNKKASSMSTPAKVGNKREHAPDTVQGGTSKRTRTISSSSIKSTSRPTSRAGSNTPSYGMKPFGTTQANRSSNSSSINTRSSSRIPDTPSASIKSVKAASMNSSTRFRPRPSSIGITSLRAS